VRLKPRLNTQQANSRPGFVLSAAVLVIVLGRFGGFRGPSVRLRTAEHEHEAKDETASTEGIRLGSPIAQELQPVLHILCRFGADQMEQATHPLANIVALLKRHNSSSK